MNFARYRFLFLIVSVALITACFVYTYTVHGGFKQSITFDGGIRFTILMPAGQGKAELEKGFTEAGYKPDQVRLSDLRLNKYDVEIGPALRDALAAELREREEANFRKIRELERAAQPVPPELLEKPSVVDVIERKTLPLLKIQPAAVVSRETIAASYGEQLTGLAIRTLLITIIAIGIYLSLRFDFPFAVGASLALVHDMIFTLGFIGVMQIEPSIPVLAAVLTVLGYSINDTIVIFDRIRENVQDRQQATLKATMNLAITQTLSRTVVTSLLTLLSVLALLLGGAQTLVDFGLVLGFGIVVGTYSSIFIASHFVQFYEEFRARWKRA